MSPRTRKPPKNLLELCVAKAGPLQGGRVAAFIVKWAMASYSAGGVSITLTDYAKWAGEKERSAFAHQERFRSVFEGFATPQPIAFEIIRSWDDARALRGVGRLVMEEPAPEVLMAAYAV